MKQDKIPKISDVVVRRLPLYLRAVEDFDRKDEAYSLIQSAGRVDRCHSGADQEGSCVVWGFLENKALVTM